MNHRTLHRLLGALMAVIVLYSCASVGRIEGGPYDETPPVFLRSNPMQGALNSARKKISLEFDEFIKLDKPGEKIVVSPPQVQQAEVKANGKKVTIELMDTLKSNVTYTFDFGDAIQDNNEGNPLENFFYSFSTGDRLDTLSVAGTLLNAENLEPVKGLLVGLHSNLADSAFTSLPLERVGRTDSRGRFSIRGVAPGSYRIFALQDADQNFYYSQPTEIIAFNDSLVIPSIAPATRQDTTWIDSLTIDTIVTRDYTRFLPDDVLLRCFKEKRSQQRFVKSERLTPEKFTLFFTAPADTLPTLRGLNFNADSAFVVELPTGRIDTIQYWIKDSLIYKIDSLRFAMDYLYTDSLNQLTPRCDTLTILPKLSYAKQQKQKEEALEKEKKEQEKRKKRGTKQGVAAEKPKNDFLPNEIYAPGTLDIYDYLTLGFSEPIVRLDSTALHLKVKVDTLWQPMPFLLEQDSTDIKKYNILAEWQPDASYSFEVDSAAIVGLYGKHTDAVKKEFKVKKLEEYGQIFFNISGVQETAFVELLDNNDKVLRTVPVESGKADFYYLNPGKYGARIIIDENKNGIWDTGCYAEKRQPEMVYYYPLILELKANFDLTQEWNVTEKSLDKQKPNELKKQKPDEEKKKRSRNQERNNGTMNNSRNNRNSGNGYSY